MKLLTVGPDNIYTYDTVKEFFASFELGPKDLLVSIEVIYKQFLEPYANGANVILVDKYGAQEPTDVMIDEFIADAGKFDYDRIVAVGGGAVMDMSKVVAVAGGASIDDVIDHLPDFKRSVRLVLVPTTCGTGSEVTEIAAINRTRLGSPTIPCSCRSCSTDCPITCSPPARSTRSCTPWNPRFRRTPRHTRACSAMRP